MDFVQACYDDNFVQSFVKLVTFHLRADRFTIGHLHSALGEGHIAKILRRLAEIGSTG